MVTIAGHRVKTVTRDKSQTVRVFGVGERSHTQEHVVRLRPPKTSDLALAAQTFQSADELLAYLTSQLGGVVESDTHGGASQVHAAVAQRTSHGHRWPRDHVELSHWGIGARDATERAIHMLVDEFCMNPMQHRVEHSIHCRLFQLLAMQPELQIKIPFSDFETQPIHKEWPEFIPRPRKRRGNFDIAILAPEIVAGASLEDFRRGWIRPTIVIEVGLDYQHTHLLSDISKLQHSGIRDSYLVHLIRDGVADNFETLESHVMGSVIKCAYARHTSTGCRVKWLSDGEIRDQPRPSAR